ncbi:TPA: glycosyltransferase [Acinetobacter baumannii]|uniref:Gtr105 n=1 Tax=Acinetobacter baumannii TaxID=470 RepID=A0A6B9D0T9_ACIBA|nr:glycosyltransferase [Acinetobacter baumannii]EKT9891498.1 glycosyltransferase [Acinetobacter baumannii]EKT9963875.1 glycosyltransferase [Acinetobacter baumannii]EKV4705692.1 glycosyltransferase [Acinetobacter baumannii]EKW3630709.1 glycosyltransferase [Acinetobacter baumannii]EKW3729705.1 glycosyltransferase [Acinetobacter baumannii]
MKILFIITSLGMGGAENVLSNLCDGLIKYNHQIKIICLKGKVIVKPTNKNIEIVSFNLNNLKDLKNTFIDCKRIINEFKPDIVHAHMFHAIIFARLLRLTVRIPKLISTAHSKSFGGLMRAILYRLTDRMSDINTNVSFEATEYFIKNKIFKPSNTLTITNGINTEKFFSDRLKRNILREQFGFTVNEHIFIAVGRFNEAKDYPNLLQSFSILLNNSNINPKLVIVGDGELRPDIEKLIIQHRLEKNVILLGIRKDINNLLNMADTFVLSSAWEGFGLVIAEAMAAEKVVISTDCGGVKEVLGNEYFLVPPKCSEALAQKMFESIQLDTEERIKIGIDNRQRILKKYSLKAMVSNWLKIYTS